MPHLCHPCPGNNAEAVLCSEVWRLEDSDLIVPVTACWFPHLFLPPAAVDDSVQTCAQMPSISERVCVSHGILEYTNSPVYPRLLWGPVLGSEFPGVVISLMGTRTGAEGRVSICVALCTAQTVQFIGKCCCSGLNPVDKLSTCCVQALYYMV